MDYKTRLQEIIQKNPEERVEYVLVSAMGLTMIRSLWWRYTSTVMSSAGE